MRELELKEKKIKEIQTTGDRLLREDHPARPTVEVGAAGTGGSGTRAARHQGCRDLGCGPQGCGPRVAGQGLEADGDPCTGLPGGPADPVELDATAVLLRGGAPEGEHGLLPGEPAHLRRAVSPEPLDHCWGMRTPPPPGPAPPCCAPVPGPGPGAQPDPFPLQFFSDVREAEEQLRKLQETLRRKYVCDRSITVTRLEDLLQDAQVSW